jgi:hypothetical protein
MTVHIKLTDNLAIGSDSNQWTLTKPVTVTDKETKTKSIQWQPFKYYSELDNAVKAAGALLLRSSHAQNAKELIEVAEKISALLSRSFTSQTEIMIKG